MMVKIRVNRKVKRQSRRNLSESTTKQRNRKNERKETLFHLGYPKSLQLTFPKGRWQLIKK